MDRRAAGHARRAGAAAPDPRAHRRGRGRDHGRHRLSERRRLGRRDSQAHVRPAPPVDDPFTLHGGARFHPLAPELLRLGIQFSDGRKATTLDLPRTFATAPDATPEAPTFVPGGGGGGGAAWDWRFWLWPLPPPGPLAFVCEWPAEGIELTRVEIDAALVFEAAARAEPLWP